jgi:biopolymer transport protein ExbD
MKNVTITIKLEGEYVLDDDEYVDVSSAIADDLQKLIEPIADKLALDCDHNINYQDLPLPCPMT